MNDQRREREELWQDVAECNDAEDLRIVDLSNKLESGEVFDDENDPLKKGGEVVVQAIADAPKTMNDITVGVLSEEFFPNNDQEFQDHERKLERRSVSEVRASGPPPRPNYNQKSGRGSIRY